MLPGWNTVYHFYLIWRLDTVKCDSVKLSAACCALITLINAVFNRTIAEMT